MDFLPKELEDIVLDYKYQLEHQEKMKSTLFSIANLEIDGYKYTHYGWSDPTTRNKYEHIIRSYYLKKTDKNKIITRTEFTSKRGMRIHIKDHYF